MITETKEQQLDRVMASMQENWRYYWCESGACGCLGCANGSGQLLSLGFSKKDWETWVQNNPSPTPVKLDQPVNLNQAFKSL